MGQRLQYISYFSPFIRFIKKHEKLLQTEKTQIKRGITLVMFMGGTILKREKAYNLYWWLFTLCHYIWPKNLKSAISGHNFRPITLAKFMGGTIWGFYFDQNGKHNNWYYWSLSLFHHILSKNMEKGKCKTTTTTTKTPS